MVGRRVWRMENELRGGFDTTWGAMRAIMTELDISDRDLQPDDAEDEFPTLGGRPRARLCERWGTMDAMDTRMWQTLDPSMPTMVLEATKLLWVNETAEELVFLPEEVNRTLEEEKCLSLFVAALYVPMDAHTRHTPHWLWRAYDLLTGRFGLIGLVCAAATSPPATVTT